MSERRLRSQVVLVSAANTEVEFRLSQAAFFVTKGVPDALSKRSEGQDNEWISEQV